MNNTMPVKEPSVTEFRMGALADLLNAVLPKTEDEAIAWSVLTVQACEYYRSNRSQYSEEGSPFVRYGNYFVSPEYIDQHKTEILDTLRRRDVYIVVRPLDRFVYAGSSREDFEQLITKDAKRVQSVVDKYNDRMTLMERRHPEMGDLITHFEKVRQIEDHNGNGNGNGHQDSSGNGV